VISRAGANAIFEFLALHKPMLLIPLESGSRGDQIVNARSFADQNFALILSEQELDKASFLKSVNQLEARAESMTFAQSQFDGTGVPGQIVAILQSHCGRS